MSVPDEMDGKIGGMRKLVSMAFPQAVPNVVAVDPSCRFGEMRNRGACIGECAVDCSQCRECPIALCVKACEKEGKKAIDPVAVQQKPEPRGRKASWWPPASKMRRRPAICSATTIYDNVITNTQFERLMNAGGPTAG